MLCDRAEAKPGAVSCSAEGSVRPPLPQCVRPVAMTGATAAVADTNPLRGLHVEGEDVGSTALTSTVARERAIPFGPISALDRDKPYSHPSSLFGAGIELGDLFSRIKEEPCNGRTLGVDNDEVPRWLLMLRVGVRTGRLAPKALTHDTILPRPAILLASSNH